ncbi:hypothetical protein UFOVP999_13 [uncultured Caudovirales phage]|uniref:Uncharacterized protein n=1 Tax=uncultured Caudovirales phage TaxID=2100421 RepID=A0A6J5PZ33_9CAUD|nr:hypothetical protein UFOVP999_13 [uncultured Caudovirales phage]
MATKKTNTFNYLGVPGLTTSGTFDNSLYTPATKPKAAPIVPPAAPSTPLPVIPTATVPTTPTTPTPSASPTPAESINYLGVQGLNPTGTFGTPPAVTAKEANAETRNAFALLKDTLASYGLEDLASTIEQFMKDGVLPQEGLLRLKTDTTKNPVTGKPYNEPYITRFAGNQARRQAGLNVYTEGEYLALEDSYSQSLRAYGQADYFGKTANERRTEAAKYIGGGVSAKEFDDVLNVVVNEVKNKDPYTKAAMKQLYGIDEAGLVKYFLDPKRNLPELQQQAQAAQIGGAALMQGVDAKGENLLSIGNSMGLAKLGVTQEQAQVGYGKIAEVLPTAQKLGNIYNEEKIAYTQGTAEEETFQNLASAKRKRMQLANKEIGTFSADSGRGKGAFSSPISI